MLEAEYPVPVGLVGACGRWGANVLRDLVALGRPRSRRRAGSEATAASVRARAGRRASFSPPVDALPGGRRRGGRDARLHARSRRRGRAPPRRPGVRREAADHRRRRRGALAALAATASSSWTSGAITPAFWNLPASPTRVSSGRSTASIREGSSGGAPIPTWTPCGTSFPTTSRSSTRCSGGCHPPRRRWPRPPRESASDSPPSSAAHLDPHRGVVRRAGAQARAPPRLRQGGRPSRRRLQPARHRRADWHTGSTRLQERPIDDDLPLRAELKVFLEYLGGGRAPRVRCRARRRGRPADSRAR